MTPRELPLACSLDAAGAEEQGARYEAIGASVESLDLGPGRLVARLGADVDRALVARAIEVERGCCPFLVIDYDDGARRLTLAAEPQHQPALEALAGLLTG